MAGTRFARSACIDPFLPSSEAATMDNLSHVQFEELLHSAGGAHLSAFLPAPSQPSEAKADAIRITNLAKGARATLAARWMPESQAEQFLDRFKNLSSDSGFLADRRHGTAVYLSDDFFGVFRMKQSPPKERITIATKFMLRPILSNLAAAAEFYILTLSKQRVGLFLVTPPSIKAVDVPGLPESFERSRKQLSADRGSQVHSASHSDTTKQAAVFHGHGGQSDSERSELTEYMRHVETAVTEYLNKVSGFVIPAGVDYETSIYRHVNTCDRMVKQTIDGNVDHFSPEQLLVQAKPIVEQVIRDSRDRDASSIEQARRKPAATDPEQILAAAFDGRIEILFIAKEASLNGSFYPDTKILKEIRREPTGDPSDACHDLIEVAIAETLKHGGRVHAVSESEMPVNAAMAAALRY